MKKINIRLLINLFCTYVLTTQLNAIQVDLETIKLIKTSSEAVSDIKADEEEIYRDTLDEQNELIRDFISEREHPVNSMGDFEEENFNGFSSSMASYYSTTHRAAYHRVINTSMDGLDVEFEDKSIWEVHSWDRSKIKRWSSSDTIVIAPNKNIFTRWSYPYKFINLDTKDVVKSKMKLTPVFNNPSVDIYVHWIDSIDYGARLIRLEDGSLWRIASGDRDVMESFSRYNIVIVGTNDGWFRGSNPNILICVKNNKYIRGIVIN